MEFGNKTRSGLISGLVVCFLAANILGSDEWFDGSWDSSNYNLIEKPRTVGLRIELVDRETGLPVKGARVLLKGHWPEEDAGPAAYVPGATTQEREFEMRAVSAGDGVVVFALSWQKEYPWLFGRPNPQVDERGNVKYYDVHSSWKRAVDDIEKVHWIEIGHPNYIDPRIPLDFNHLTEFGQDKGSERQNPQLFKEFEEVWHREMRKPGVKFCAMNIGPGFSDFGNKHSTRPEFFDRIKAKDYGRVYLEPMNMMSPDENRPSVAGPYFVYQLRVELERRPGQMDVQLRRDTIDDAMSSRKRNDSSAEEERQRNRETERQPMERESESSRQREAEERAEREQARRLKLEREQHERDVKAAAVNRPGVATRDYNKEKREEVNRDMGMPMGIVGVVISYVDPSSPSYEAGLREGMIVTSVKWRHSKGMSNIAPSSAEYFDEIMKNRKSGESIELSIWRKSDGNNIKEGYAGSEQKGKWYRDTLRFTID